MSLLLLGLQDDVRERAEEHLSLCAADGIVVRVTQGLRSFAAQQRLWDQGRGAPGPIVTNARPGYSWHCWGRAYDLAIVNFPGDTTPADVYDGPWARVGELGEQAGLEWGGRWKHPDVPHFQLTVGATFAALLAAHPAGLA